MMVSPARQLAYEILLRVESGRGFAVDALQRSPAGQHSARDLRLTTELVMGVLRAHGDLNRTIEEISGRPLAKLDPEIATILRLGIFQIRYLTKIPKHAAVHDAVELAKLARHGSAAGLVNAVLRKCEPAGAAASSEEEWTRRAVRSLPAWLAERWEKNFGKDAMQALARASLATPPIVLRVTGADAREEAARLLVGQGIRTRAGNFSPLALILNRERPEEPVNRRETSAAQAIKQAGMIQDEASQLIAPILAVEPGSRVLDLCAAPGIKTLQIAQALGQGRIVAADRSAGRLRTMRKLLSGSIPCGVEVHSVRMDASATLPFGILFDRILVDAPCSGTGTLARNPEIKLRLVPADLSRLARIQEQILSNALEVLRPAGRLVYATCSLEPEENEHVIEKVLSGRPSFEIVPRSALSTYFPLLAPLFSTEGLLRTRPDRDGMDGFFAAVIERRLP